MSPGHSPDSSRTALITGGSSGIGLAIARALHSSGCNVAISGRRQSALDEAAPLIGPDVLKVAGDVAQPAEAASMVQATVERFGALHVLVNNAAVARGGPIEDMDDATIDLVIDIDVKGPFYLIREALPHLRQHRESGTATILNISSSVTSMALKNYSLYSAAKAAIDMMTRCLALELATDRIRVNAILPGIVDTPIFETMMPKERVREFLETFADAVPLGRAGRPEDVARIAEVLCDPSCDWLTGALIPVDGGLGLGPNS